MTPDAASARRSLDRAEILATAHAIIRADGLDALNMRRLARELGVTPMAIYHHVDNKQELLQAMVEDVWLRVAAETPGQADDLIEWTVQTALVTRRVWLDNVALVRLAMAVAPVDDFMLGGTRLMASILAAAGFPDVGLAASALQSYTLGSVAILANRRVASAYFGRDPDQVLAAGLAALESEGASDDERGVLIARFDDGDDAHFEPGLRALLRGLLGSAPPEPPAASPAPDA